MSEVTVISACAPCTFDEVRRLARISHTGKPEA